MTSDSSRGSGNGRRRGGTRDGRSMIAGRRPASKKPTEESPLEKDPAQKDATAKDATAKDAAASVEATPKKPVRRRRSRTKKTEANAVTEESVLTDKSTESAESNLQATPSKDKPSSNEEPATTPRRRRSATSKTAETDGVQLEALVKQLASEVEGQHGALVQIGASVDELSRRLDRAARKPRLGVFVDVPNVLYGLEAGEAPLDMGKLLTMLSEGRELVRATAYAPVSDDPREAVERQKFVAPFVPHAYRIVTKPMKRFADGSVKGNFDVEMAIDLVTMSERLDVVVIVSGDSDFARAVEIVQSRGIRVEVVAFAGSTSIEMRALADHYLELDRVTDQLR